MNPKLVAIDLDGTTLDTDGNLSSKNRKAIIDVLSNGMHLCIASGRAFETLPVEVASIPGIEYAITGNGVSVYRIKDAKKLQTFTMTPQSVDSIMKITEHEPITYEAFIDGKAYASQEYIDHPQQFGATPWTIEYVKSTRSIVPDIRTLIKENRQHLDSLNIVINDDFIKEKIVTEITNNTNDVYITSSVKQLLEISHKNCGKKTGVKFLAELLNILPEDVIAIGDGDNDLDMIDYAGTGIAMANSTDNLKAKADYVTLNNDQDGLHYAFHDILHII